MDERKLEELFRDSVQSVPPASFDEHDVARASRRITARRRMTALGGTVAVAAVLAGGVVMVMPPESSVTSKQAQPEVSTASPRSEDGPGILTDRGGRCGPDAQVAAAVTKELPEAASTAPVAAPDCPSGAKVASFVLREGAAAGSVTVIVSPAGTVPPEQSKTGDTRHPDGTEQSVRQARSGKLVVVRSDPDEGSPAAPYRTRLPSIAGGIAGQF
ncbi:hypothetical protein SAMN02982929_05421 [Saccharopolyspora kobensis]|uniref:Uncharacterized protein n=1 Tax=Saccharopolyspora kobensis TaxID=146035 RepID=A0A1H6E2Z5_9PSEU|nr:hypothetical protein [Saccharopolyspora kobensis]SEG91265.1 hypothetical protein SAMN02982929_05421 [Saccharopolyspora kobensis]SFF14530.1 hypothetical protein SAMN05216506_12057 [Saccharopolyspora kobensis]